jgi:hypothetical protein
LIDKPAVVEGSAALPCAALLRTERLSK